MKASGLIVLYVAFLLFLIQSCAKPADSDPTPPPPPQNPNPPSPNPGTSAPLDSAMTVYSTNWDTLFAFNAWDGSKKWAVAIPGLHYAGPSYGNGMLYLSLGTDKKIVAVDTTGKIRWTKTIEAYPNHHQVTVGNGLIYSSDGYRNLFALDALTGNTKWQIKTMSVSYGKLVLVDGVIYYNAANLYAIDALTGHTIWSTYTGGNVPPVVYFNKIYASAATDFNTGGLNVVNRTTGALIKKISFNYPSDVITMNAGNGYLYCLFPWASGSPDRMSAFDTTDLSIKWTLEDAYGPAGASFLKAGFEPVILDSFVIIHRLGAINFYDAFSGKLSWQRKSSAQVSTCVHNIIYSSGPLTNSFYDRHVVAAFDRSRNVFKWSSAPINGESSGPICVVTKSDKMFLYGP